MKGQGFIHQNSTWLYRNKICITYFIIHVFTIYDFYWTAIILKSIDFIDYIIDFIYYIIDFINYIIDSIYYITSGKVR